MRKLLLLFIGCLISASAFAQIPTVTIADIQTVSAAKLAACVDSANYFGDTVTVYGVVVTPGGEANSASGRQIWIQDGPGPWNGLNVRYSGNGATSPDDMLDLVAGDSVRFTGVIGNFTNETQLDPLPNGVELVDVGKDVHRSYVDVSALNDQMRTNIITTGEQWEGVYITLRNVTVTSVDFFSGNTRVSFNVADGNGNTINISDRFNSQRIANGFTPPTINSVYDSISGVVSHSANGCLGGGRGYELFPYTTDDLFLQAGTSGPLISGINRSPLTPTSSQDVTVRANIEDPDGTISSADLKYAVGIGNNSYNTITMMNTGGTTYEGVIPSSAIADGDFVKYYITATDNTNITSSNPDVPSMSFDPLFFFVRDNGLTIYDVQFTPYSNGNSGYLNLDVTLKGIVTASSEATNLGTVFIQQPNTTQPWTGLQLVPGAAALTGLVIGDSVEVNGTIQEDFGLTRMQVNMITNHGAGSSVITPKEVNPDDFTVPNVMVTEAYESMLVTLKNPMGGDIYVADANADGTNNFGEYRVGNDEFEPLVGCRVLAGRKTGSAPGSLNFSYVNDSMWTTNSGTMNVPPCVVVESDKMASMTGIMYYGFSQMKLLPRTNADMEGFRGANCSVGVGIEDDLKAGELVLYPNPANHSFTLQYNFGEQRNAQVRVFDMMGRQMASATISGDFGKITFDSQNWAHGTYFVKVQTEGNEVASKKVIIVR
jgi:hypothetical protein